MAQISAELGISEATSQSMCATIREGVVKKSVPSLGHHVEADKFGPPMRLCRCRPQGTSQ